MPYDFDQIIDRRLIPNINKWKLYPDDVLPFWLADMDFLTPAPVLDALRGALDHGILGYELASPSLLELVAGRLEKLHNWAVSPEMVVPVPSVNVGYRVAASISCQPGDGILVQPPVFYHFLDFPVPYGFILQEAPLRRIERGNTLAYTLEAGGFRQAIHSQGAKTSMFLLCNPHNPVGHTFTQEELVQMAEICAEHDIVICSDDIHQELLLGDVRYTPIAALSPAIAERTITLIGPGKTFNVSGLSCAFAVIPQPARRQMFSKELERLALDVNSLGLAAARAAYSGACDDWLWALRLYLTANRDYLVDFVTNELPGMRTTLPDATYLAWLDCNEFVRTGRISTSPGEFFLEAARVALSDGKSFGQGGDGFVRLNFACPRSVLEAGLRRMKKALD